QLPREPGLRELREAIVEVASEDLRRGAAAVHLQKVVPDEDVRILVDDQHAEIDAPQDLFEEPLATRPAVARGHSPSTNFATEPRRPAIDSLGMRIRIWLSNERSSRMKRMLI